MGQENSYEMPSEHWSKDFVHDGVLDGQGFSTNPYDSEPDASVQVVLTFDLGRRCSVSKFGVFARAGAIFPTDYQIETSLDGEMWSVAAEQTGAPKDPAEPYFYELDSAVEARYVRLNVTKRYAQDSIGGAGNDGKLVQLQEFAIWGTVVQESGGDEKPTGTKDDIASWALDGTANIALNKKVSVSSDFKEGLGCWESVQLTDGVIVSTTAPYGTAGRRTHLKRGQQPTRLHGRPSTSVRRMRSAGSWYSRALTANTQITSRWTMCFRPRTTARPGQISSR